jgi:hypothetical protein
VASVVYLAMHLDQVSLWRCLPRDFVKTGVSEIMFAFLPCLSPRFIFEIVGLLVASCYISFGEYIVTLDAQLLNVSVARAI